MDRRPENPVAQFEEKQPPANSASGLPASETLAPAQHPVHTIFVGPDGLRGGWRLVLFLLIAASIGFVLGALTSHWHPQGAGKLWLNWLFELEFFVAIAASAFVMSRIEGRAWGAYGLPVATAFGRNFWVGALWGFFWLTVLMLIMRAAGVFYFGGVAVHGLRMLRFAAFYGLVFLTVAFFEEFLFRGYTQFTLAQGIGFWPAAFLLSAGFGAVHLNNTGEAWLGIFAAALIGLFFCLTLRRTGTLWFAVGFHAAWDWSESFLYSVPDSGEIAPGHLLNSSFHGSRWLTGGSVGPEGSVLVFAVIAAAAFAFDRVYSAKRLNSTPVTS
ncbi:MAG TPA: type II CAAX endopeptidase family protein [Terriglobales bacterium]